jgi:hypothetical protein
LAERGVDVDASCIWRWVQTNAPELNQRYRLQVKPANKSYGIDETYIKVKGEDKYLYRAVDSTGHDHQFSAHGEAGCEGSDLSRQSGAAPKPPSSPNSSASPNL